jgi:hypothetical protein
MSPFSWLTTIGSLVGLVTGIIGAFKAFMDDRPFAYFEPDNQLDGFLKLYVVNAGKRSIFLRSSYVRSARHWYVAPNASPMTGKGRQHAKYGRPEAPSHNWRDQNVIIESGKRHEFFVGTENRDVEPTWCFVLISWQPLGGFPLCRPPLLLYKSKGQIMRLFRARKGKHDN